MSGAARHALGFVVILVVGWFIASALAAVVSAVLRAVKFNDLAQRAALTGFVQQMGLKTDAAVSSRLSRAGSCG